MKIKIKKIYLIFTALILVSFFYRAYPHMFLVDRWMQEEEAQWAIVKEFVETGKVFFRAEFQPTLSHRIIYYMTVIIPLEPITVSQYATAMIGSLLLIPIFLLLKLYLSTKKSLLACLIFSFYEIAFYKSAKLAPETFGFFFLLWAIYFLVRSKKRQIYFVGTIVFLILTFYTHLVPLIFGVALIFFDAFLFESKKKKVIFAVISAIFIIFIYSPYSSAGKALTFLNPLYLFSMLDLSNIINLYSLTDLIDWLPTFLGTFIIVGSFGYLLLKKRLEIFRNQPKIFLSLFVTASAIFAFTWIGHNAAMFSPFRILPYLILSLICLIINKVEIKRPLTLMVPVLIVLMIFSSVQVCSNSLWVDYATTENEYKAMEELVELGIFQPTESITKWFVDVSGEYMMLPYLELKWMPTVNEDTLIWNYDNETIKIYYTRAEGNFSAFKHVFISERMEEGALFRNWHMASVFSGRKGRTAVPIVDTLVDDPNWIQVYNNYGVKVYEQRLFEK